MAKFVPVLLAMLVMCFCAESKNASKVFKDIGKNLETGILTVVEPISEGVFGVISKECAIVKKILGVSYEQLEKDNKTDVDSLTLEYRDAEVVTIYNITTAAQRIPEDRKFNFTQKLYIFLHGFTDNPSKDTYKTISTALMSEGQTNVLALDASSLISKFYLRAATYVQFIGQKLGEVLAAMVNGGLDPAKVHIMGHSLGGHIAGFTGKTFTNLTGQQLGRITGLDPAGPCFTTVKADLRIKATDASFVDVIHTDGGVFGMKEALGQVDYYPNGGERQPGCFINSDSCDHSRVWKYFAESVTSPDAFPAVKCDSYEAFKKGQCGSETSLMGFACPPGTTGIYYLRTSDDSPYGLGEDGTVAT